jgi:hypothetical protein
LLYELDVVVISFIKFVTVRDLSADLEHLPVSEKPFPLMILTDNLLEFKSHTIRIYGTENSR